MRRLVLESWSADLRYGLRSLRRTPAFTAVAVLSVGVGIAASTALFTVADALLLRPLAVRNPERLITLEQVLPSGTRLFNFSYLDIESFQSLVATNVLAGAAGISWADGYAGRGPIEDSTAAKERVNVGLVTGGYFPVLGVRARLGRLLTPEDDRVAGESPVAVISDRYWKERFDRAPDVLGKPLLVNGTSYTIVGVTDGGFAGDWIGWPTDMWVPSAMAAQIMVTTETRDRRLRLQYKLMARLAPGVSVSAARAAAAGVYQDLQKHPPAMSGVSATAKLDIVSAATGYSPQRGTFVQPLRILLTMVAVVMLIVCVNVANLLLARSAVRGRELAVRLAIGATRARLVRQLFTENLLLGVAGAVVGVLLSYWAADSLLVTVRSGPVSTVVSGIPSIDLAVSPDKRVIGFTAALAVLVSIAFGLAPALRASRVPIRAAMSRRMADSGFGGRNGPRKALLIVQVAASMMLLIGTGLFVATVGALKKQDLGFDRNRLLLVWTLPGPTGREGAALVSMWEGIESGIAAIAGVSSASASVEGLLSGNSAGGPLVTVEGGMNGAPPIRIASTTTIGPRYFETLRQPLLEGREFSQSDDAAAPAVVIVNQAFARQAFGAASPIGRRIHIGSAQQPPTQIVGVVRDAIQRSPRSPIEPTLYYPQGQNVRRLARAMCVIVRTAGDPAEVAVRVRQELARIEPGLAVLKIDTVAGQLDSVLFQERLVERLSVCFAIVALFLTCIGLYGVMSFVTARRTAEVGLRMALGATRGTVIRGVFAETGAIVAAGIVLGVPLTLAALRLVSNRLFGVSAADPWTIGLAALVMLTVAIVAVAIPARRASGIDPLAALRTD